jgi:hypothetical protein
MPVENLVEPFHGEPHQFIHLDILNASPSRLLLRYSTFCHP